MWQNKRRDRKAADSGLSKEEQERLGREMGERVCASSKSVFPFSSIMNVPPPSN